jgi:hypothetical protein
MQVTRNLSKRLKIVVQIPKITFLWGTGGVRPYHGISGISNTIQHCVCLKVRSKNRLFYKFVDINISFTLADQSRPNS